MVWSRCLQKARQELSVSESGSGQQRTENGGDCGESGNTHVPFEAGRPALDSRNQGRWISGSEIRLT